MSDKDSAEASLPRSRRESLGSVSSGAGADGGRRGSVGTVPSSHSRGPSGGRAAAGAAPPEDIIAAAAAASGVDIVGLAAQQRQQAAEQQPTSQQQQASGRNSRGTARQQQQRRTPQQLAAGATSSAAPNSSTQRSGSGRRTVAANAAGAGAATTTNTQRGGGASSTVGGGAESTIAGGGSPNPMSTTAANSPPATASSFQQQQQVQAGFPGFAARSSRKASIGGRLAQARIHSGINQHEIASKCGIPVNKIFSLEKGQEQDLERWATALAHIAISLGVPFLDLFGDYVSCTSSPVLVNSSNANNSSSNAAASAPSNPSATVNLGATAMLLSGTYNAATMGGGVGATIMSMMQNATTSSSPRQPIEPPAWKLTVGGRVKRAREVAKVSNEMMAQMLDDAGVLTKEEYEDLEMCDSPAEDSIPILLYYLYRTGACLATIVL